MKPPLQKFHAKSLKGKAMSELQAQLSELTMTIQVTRAATGLVEEYVLAVIPEPELTESK